jgi:hypothetical protein
MSAFLKILGCFSTTLAMAVPPVGIDRNLHDERNLNNVDTKDQVEYLQQRLDRISMRCEGKSHNYCKAVPDIDNDIKELRGRSSKATPTVTAQVRAIDAELLNIERKFMAE